MRVLAISGSLRAGSYNSALVAAAAECRSEAQVVVWRGLDRIPAFNEDIDAVPAVVTSLRLAIARSDGVLIATPEYNGSIPGVLKNALDWVSRPYPENALRGKPVRVMGASQGTFGALWAQADLRRILKTIGADVADRDLPVAQAHEAFSEEGRLRDPALARALCAAIDDLMSQAARLRAA
jgi:chromate reductase, NAD(P)H dehydrogenase (quinone)